MRERRVYVLGAGEPLLCALLFLCFGLHAPGAATLEETSSFFPLLLFFFLIISTADGAINEDQAKYTSSDQLLLTLATLCKGEKICEVRF
jgi:hypothetical protein